MDMSEMDFNIKPTNDYIFKQIFGDENNKDILISFLNALFKEYDFLPKVNDLEFKNSETGKKYDIEKQGRLDIKAKIDDGTYVDIEVQTKDCFDLIDRGICYCSRIISENTKRGGDYREPKVISIWIIKNKPLKDNPHYYRQNPIEIDQHFTLPGVIDKDYVKTTNKTTLIYIYLSKFKEGLYNKDIENWIKFIDNQNIFNVTDSEIEKANEKLTYLRSDEETKTIMDSVYEKEMDNEANKKRAKEEAVMEGEKRGIKKGVEMGREEGIKEGREEGAKSEKFNLARNMLKKGYNITEVSELSGLSIEEIKNL